ncbi:hypothetical protein ScPMuIL_008251 [Solemya velum]
MKLASAGDDIKIWDCSGFSLVKQLNPHDQNINAIQWSSDNKFLASVSENAEKIALVHVKNTAAYTFAELDCGIGVKCIDFNSTSRYLLTGGNKVVTLWDLKGKKVKKSYKDHKSAVTCACFNWNDTYIASGSDTGEVILHNVITGQASSPLIGPKVQAIRQLQYNKYKKSLLGSVSDDGAVNLWDTNTRRLVHNFSNGHIAPATGLAFSQINEILMISVGLDKKIIFYDLHNKMPVKTMTVESPLTSVDMNSDGATLAVGSTRGKIYIYDLRQGNTPVNMINGHKSSVQCLSFQFTNATGGKSTAAPVTSGHRQLPTAPTNNVRLENSSGKISLRGYRNKEILTPKQKLNVPEGPHMEDVFSPIHDGFQEHSSEHVDSRDSFGHYNSSLKQEDSYSGVFSPVGDGLGKLSGVGLNSTSFSNNVSEPLKDSSYGVPVKLDYNKLNGECNVPVCGDGDVLPSGAVNPQYSEFEAPIVSEHVVVDSLPSSFTVSDQIAVSSAPSERLSPSKNEKSPNIPHGRPSPSRAHHNMQPGDSSYVNKLPISPSAGVVTRTNTDVTSGCRDSTLSRGYSVSAAPSTHTIPHVSSASAASASAISPQGAENAQTFQTEFIRNLINEAIEDFRDEIHRDMLNLHVEMLRQFQIQLAEVQSLVQHYSVNESLVAEVEKLKEENRRLKKNF